MSGWVLRRVAWTVPVLLAVSLLVFLILSAVPGDAASAIAGTDATGQDIDAIRHNLGLDRPLPVQFAGFVLGAVQGDLGTSFRTKRAVTAEIGDRLWPTAELALSALAFAVVVGLGVGVLAAVRPYSLLDYVTTVLALTGVSMPIFWLGLMLMLLFSVQLGWLPTTGNGSIQQLILPAVTLGSASAAIIARMTRSSMLEVLRQDYVVTARAKGLPEGAVVLRHALRNAMIPTVTVVGLQFGYLLGGSVLTETVFARAGLGTLLVDAIRARDFPIVQGTILFLATVFVVVNLLVDLTYGWLDPRIRHAD
jgi:peptide/nickel transport system permease protein